jgi:hypothetical protein
MALSMGQHWQTKGRLALGFLGLIPSVAPLKAQELNGFFAFWSRYQSLTGIKSHSEGYPNNRLV